MRLGIPGSTATVFPDRVFVVAGEHVGGDGEDHGRLVAGRQHGVATVHMAQHFMQPWSSAAGGSGSAAPG